eukprot:TRINITY_DN63947_c0_g1_i1.p1 TRINITY_DN63947_c0_g1~~TRINITY_DN63947_c0_g1_i1.p1  ORF type:complete len:471 (+),score=78.91 TRINITY_DN63947_c0_g1_i1:95-1507(+)
MARLAVIVFFSFVPLDIVWCMHEVSELFSGGLRREEVDSEALMDSIMPQQADENTLDELQSVHWVFVTDCSAYQFNQGNMLLASAEHVDQPGSFTWLTYGCTEDEQKAAFNQLPHPRATVWHHPATPLVDPLTGEHSAAFQASNRPGTVFSWLRDVNPQEEAIGIVDPDMFFMRAVYLVKEHGMGDTSSVRGPWKVPAAEPGHGVAVRYGIGCVLTRFNDSTLEKVCGKNSVDQCKDVRKNEQACSNFYSSGPPWILHHNDAENVLGAWVGAAIRVHDAWPDLLAEQGAFSIAQVQHGVDNKLDPFWMLSNVDATDQPWDVVANLDWDPCQERSPPPKDMAVPPLWHACSCFNMPGFSLHKDHIHKDLLDCNAPLLFYPPKNSLAKLKPEKERRRTEFMSTWSVCTYTNLVNAHAAAWKRKFCEKPNLHPTFMYPPHAQSFLDKASWMRRVFRRGGWTDIDYKPSGLGKK